jgi:histone H3/H4
MNKATRDEIEDLRRALQLAVCKIIFEEDREQGTRTTQGAISALTELTFQYATKSLVPDLYTFSTHANRKSTITPDDVAVALRKLQPDQLEAFKKNFCRGNSKTTSSKNNSTTENNKRKAAPTGRQRKRSEAEILSLSSSSSSSDDYESAGDTRADRKQKRASRMQTTSFDSKNNTSGTTVASGAFTTRRNRSNASSIPNTTGRKSSRGESLLNKFQLESLNNKKDTFDSDTSSTDDDDIARSGSRGITVRAGTKASVAAKESMSSRKLSLKRIQNEKTNEKTKGTYRSDSNLRNRNDLLLDGDDDSTDDDDTFLNRNANTTKKKTSIENDRLLAHPSGQQQSQVAEALANLSSDSGMDEDDSEDENAGKSSSSSRHRRLIESSDDD